LIAFKAVNGVLFTILGTAIVVRVLMVPGAGLRVIPGVVLGLAMLGLGVYRTFHVVRAARR
jgi:hypothetical protein